MAEALVLDNFTLVDGTGGAPVPRAPVVVEDGVIVSVGTASTPIADTTVVAGRGRWLLPGLWDTHMHHRFSAGGCSCPRSSPRSSYSSTGVPTWPAGHLSSEHRR